MLDYIHEENGIRIPNEHNPKTPHPRQNGPKPRTDKNLTHFLGDFRLMVTSLAASTPRTEHDHTAPPELKRPVVVFDGGNRTLQWIDPANKPRSIPAVIKHFDPTWEEATPDENSVVISVGNEHFCLGAVARDMKGTPVFQNNKCEL